MRRRYAVVGLAAVVGTGVWALPSASAGDRARDDGDDHDGRVIRVVAREIDSADLDLGKRGFSLGDRFVFTDNLFRHGMRVGSDHGECTATRIHGSRATFQCTATAVLRRGQLTVQGAVTFSENDSSPFRLAVTGGTGRFSDAEGEVMVDDNGGGNEVLTFHLED